jgi:very-short-patch-repair endonuclease
MWRWLHSLVTKSLRTACVSSHLLPHDLHMPTITRSTSVDARILSATLEGFPVVTRRAMRRHGVGRNLVARRLADGRLVELWPGTFLVGMSPSCAPSDVIHAAAVATVMPQAALDGTTALHRREMWPRHDGSIHVASARGHAPIPRYDVTFHRRVVTAATAVDGIPTCTAVDALGAAAPLLTAHQLAHVIMRGQYLGELDLEAVEHAAQHGIHRRWRSRLRRAVELRRMGSAGTRSHSEDVLLPRATAAFGEPFVNVRGVAGMPDYEPDMCWPDRRWIIEVDGDQHSDDPDERRRDLQRDELLRASGWIVVRVPWREARYRPAAAIRRARAAFGI